MQLNQQSSANVTEPKKPLLKKQPRIAWFIPLDVFIGVLALISLIMAISTREMQFFLLAASLFLTFITGVLSYTNLFTAPTWVKVFLFTFFLEISITLLASIFPSFSGIPYAIIAIALAFLLSSFIQQNNSSDWVITLGIIGAISSFLLSIISPFPQINNSMISGVVAAFATFFAIWTIGLFVRNTLVATLRTKLILGSLALTLVPLAILSVINNRYLQTAIQDQSNQSLTVAAEQTSQSVDEFITARLDSLVNESKLSIIQDYIDLNVYSRKNSAEAAELQTALESFQTKEKVYLPSYAVLDPIGENIYDTDAKNIGESERYTNYFQNTVVSGVSYVSPVEFLPGTRESYLYFITPIKNESAQIVGYLRARYDARILQSIIDENVGLIGNRSYPILLDENGVRLADGFSPNQIYHSVVPFSTDQYNSLLSNNRLPQYIAPENISIAEADIAGAMSKIKTNRFFTTTLSVQGRNIVHSGVITPLTSQPWSIVYLQDQSNLTTALASQNRLSSTISAIIAGIVGILITIVANLISTPILRLTDAAEKITAGDFDVQAKVTTNDEIGVLGRSFNSMTLQIKDLIDTLENRVRERTIKLAEQNESLQFRSRQLQTVSDVARSIVSTHELDTLLTTVTKLVSERFGFYHTGIFLLDPSGEYAVLRAANSEGGQRMLARQHRLRVGQVGIVGYAAGTGEPRIATDVGEDAVFFNNPDLPDTKSEMALPLKLGDRVIGALDVQSVESNAFSTEDIELFSTLADQIAIAINNSQLYEETAKALEESQNLYRQYLRQEWSHQNLEIGSRNYKFTPDGLVPFDEDLPEIDMVLNTARPVLRNQKSSENENNSIMAVPIILNNESIGAIYLKETGTNSYVWSQSELSTVQAVADQVAQTLENARLFEQTIRRADRERKVLEITSKIRSTNDPQEMLMITLEELKRNLGVKQAQIVLNMDNQQIAGSQTVDSTSSDSAAPKEGASSL